MVESQDKWMQNSRPYFEALEGLQLPPKTADAMANIDNRLKKVVQTLQATKARIKGT